MPRYRVILLNYGTRAYTQEVVVEAINAVEAEAEAEDLARARDFDWEKSGDEMFDAEIEVDQVEAVPDDTPLTEDENAG